MAVAAAVDVGAVAKAVRRSVVGVEAGRRRATGVVVAPELVVTTAHNVAWRRERSAPVAVVTTDGRRLTASVAGAWPEVDVAVLRLDTDGGEPGLAPVAWGDPASVSIGDVVVAVAAPAGVLRATPGSVATTEARFASPTGAPLLSAIEHTAPLPRGASGGPVLDAEGRMLAVDTHRAGGGLYQAVPADQAFRDLVDGLGRGEVPPRRRLGVAVATPAQTAAMHADLGLPARDGVLVRGVDPDGPAGQAGVRRGDLLVSVDGTTLGDPADLLVALRHAGETVTLALLRGHDEHQVQARFSGES